MALDTDVLSNDRAQLLNNATCFGVFFFKNWQMACQQFVPFINLEGQISSEGDRLENEFKPQY